jgi:hypothetical protein
VRSVYRELGFFFWIWAMSFKLPLVLCTLKDFSSPFPDSGEKKYLAYMLAVSALKKARKDRPNYLGISLFLTNLFFFWRGVGREDLDIHLIFLRY